MRTDTSDLGAARTGYRYRDDQEWSPANHGCDRADPLLLRGLIPIPDHMSELPGPGQRPPQPGHALSDFGCRRTTSLWRDRKRVRESAGRPIASHAQLVVLEQLAHRELCEQPIGQGDDSLSPSCRWLPRWHHDD